MYLSLNFRWPMLLGQNGNPTPSTCGSTPVSNSAFKSVTAGNSCPNNMALPPISCLKEGTGPLLPSLAAAQGGQVGLHPSSSLCQNFMHHPDPQLAGLAGYKDMPGMPPVHGALPSTSGLVPGAAGSSSAHPAFPVSMPPWLQHPQAYNLAHLQHLIGQDKSVALSQYLNDPLAKAALMDLGRVGLGQFGQYPLGKKLFGCPQCRYITDRKNNLKRHIATMHQECDKVLECCGIPFKNKASLRDHVLIFHSNGYMCRYCGRNFCRKALLKRHLTVHSGQKDYICSLCDYATSHKSNLERHKKVHERQGQDGEYEGNSPELKMKPEDEPETDEEEEDISVTEDGDDPAMSLLPPAADPLVTGLHLSHNIHDMLHSSPAREAEFSPRSRAAAPDKSHTQARTLSPPVPGDDSETEEHSNGLIDVVDIGD